RADREVHLLADAVHDERLFAADRVSWQRLVGESDSVRLLNDGHDLNRFDDGETEHARSDGGPFAFDHGAGGIDSEAARRLHPPKADVVAGAFPHRFTAADGCRGLGAAMVGARRRPVVERRCRHILILARTGVRTREETRGISGESSRTATGDIVIRYASVA